MFRLGVSYHKRIIQTNLLKAGVSMSVPPSLQNMSFRFCLVNGKIPIEKDWQNSNNYPYNHPKLCLHQNRGNYGVLGGYGNLLILDFDNIEAQEESLPQLPPTFSVVYVRPRRLNPILGSIRLVASHLFDGLCR